MELTEWPSRGRQVADVDLHIHAVAVRGGADDEGAIGQAGVVRERGDVLRSSWIACDDGRGSGLRESGR